MNVSDCLEESCPFPGSSLYVPNGQDVRGGMVVLHGSEGAPFADHAMAQFLATNGFAALFFAWCAHPKCPIEGVPSDVIDISLERTAEAIQWLQHYPGMESKKTALYGVSRGAEQALLAASLQGHPHMPCFDAVAVHASTASIVMGWSWSWWDEENQRVIDSAVDPDAKAWLWCGLSLGVGQPIPVYAFGGPVFLSHGVQDTTWGPAWGVEQSRTLEKRLRGKRETSCVVEAHYLEGEGHVLSEGGMRLHQADLLNFFGRHLQ